MKLDQIYDYRTAHCCHVGCDKEAEFEIVPVRATAEGDGLAGPDPYSDDTHACEEHVGALLTFQPEAVETGNIYWHVRTLAPAMLSGCAADGRSVVSGSATPNGTPTVEPPRFALSELRELRKALSVASSYIAPVGLAEHATAAWREAKKWLDRVDSLIEETEEGGFDA